LTQRGGGKKKGKKKGVWGALFEERKTEGRELIDMLNSSLT